MNVKIYQLDRGVEIYIWLCDKHVAKRKRAGWEVKGRKTVAWELACQDCPR